jgi:hypothetical protein
VIKVFISCLQSPISYSIPAYSFWEYYFKNGLNEGGVNWCEGLNLDWAKGLLLNKGPDFELWKTDIWERTLDAIKKEPVDIFLSYLYPHMVDESAIAELKRRGIPCVNFYCDNVRDFSCVPEAFKIFNLNWVPEYEAYIMYTKERVDAINLPMPMWIAPEMRNNAVEKGQRISFIGSEDLLRDRFISNINNIANFKVDVYGKRRGAIQKPHSIKNLISNQFDYIKNLGISSWMNKTVNNFQARIGYAEHLKQLTEFYQGELTSDDYMHVTRESMVTVGINRFYDIRLNNREFKKYSKLRDIEATMLGACYLTEYTTGLENLFEIGKDVLVYHDERDFIDQIGVLANNLDLRKQLRINGTSRALNELSIPVSLLKLFNHLGLKA